MGLEQLMDGALCTAVLVRGDAGAIAEAVQLCSGTEGRARGWVAQLRGTDWCRVELDGMAELSGRGYDSDPLLREALSAMRDTRSGGPVGYDTPVRLARRLSSDVSGGAIAVWASDQGPGLSGAVRFEAGKRLASWSALDPAGVSLIDAVRHAEAHGEDDGSFDDRWDELEDRAELLTWTPEGPLEGPVARHVDDAVRSVGVDPAWLDEPLFFLAERDAQVEWILSIVSV
ncbi:MAG: hypothetical protein KDA24_28640 [Deltaproteobacteria bacterium]|nr:hypothetical protein [Deltaproteobacteria bacterium]